MKIQIINYNGTSDFENIFTFSKLSEPKSLDEFDINIIDLRSKELWRYYEREPSNINAINDLLHLKIMMVRSKHAASVIVLPQNILFSYDYNGYQKVYSYYIELKNNLDAITEYILPQLIPKPIPMLFYENTTTIINGTEFTASFYFQEHSPDIGVTTSISYKITSCKFDDKFYLTTLDIFSNKDSLMAFLKECNLISDKEEYPQWLLDYKILNDKELQNLITEKETLIENAKKEIVAAKSILDSNLEYKSILFTNGDSLANQIFKILEAILGIDLSGFLDKKNEDFLIEMSDDFEFIGEIKGVTSNVKREHISQLEDHYQGRLDDLGEDSQKEIKALLIINPLRKTPINDREPIHDTQINLAIRNESLIITTKSILDIYELFTSDKLTSDKCIEMFRNEIGLLTYEIISKYCKGS